MDILDLTDKHGALNLATVSIHVIKVDILDITFYFIVLFNISSARIIYTCLTISTILLIISISVFIISNGQVIA